MPIGAVCTTGVSLFIRHSTKKEDLSPTAKHKAFRSFEERRGFEIVYKPYGEQGRGFYYAPLQRMNPRPTREEDLAMEGYEHFHGKTSEKITTDRIQWPPPQELIDRFGNPGGLPAWVSALGELLSISYEKENDDGELFEEETLEFKKPYPLLCSDYMSMLEEEETLYIIGGNYKAHREEDLICGNIIWVEYLSVKSFDDFQPVNYKHRFDSPWPVLAQSKDLRQLYIFRGDSNFFIERQGNVSAGIAG